MDDRFWELGLSPSEVVLLQVLGRRMNENRECWPSLATICKDSGMSKNTVKAARGKLKKKRLLSYGPKQKSDPKSVTNYKILCQYINTFKGSKSDPLVEKEGSKIHLGGVKNSPLRGQKLTIEGSKIDPEVLNNEVLNNEVLRESARESENPLPQKNENGNQFPEPQKVGVTKKAVTLSDVNAPSSQKEKSCAKKEKAESELLDSAKPIHIQAADFFLRWLCDNRTTLAYITEAAMWQGDDRELHEELRAHFAHRNNSGERNCKAAMKNPMQYTGRIQSWLQKSKQYARTNPKPEPLGHTGKPEPGQFRRRTGGADNQRKPLKGSFR